MRLLGSVFILLVSFTLSRIHAEKRQVPFVTHPVHALPNTKVPESSPFIVDAVIADVSNMSHLQILFMDASFDDKVEIVANRFIRTIGSCLRWTLLIFCTGFLTYHCGWPLAAGVVLPYSVFDWLNRERRFRLEVELARTRVETFMTMNSTVSVGQLLHDGWPLSEVCLTFLVLFASSYVLDQVGTLNPALMDTYSRLYTSNAPPLIGGIALLCLASKLGDSLLPLRLAFIEAMELKTRRLVQKSSMALAWRVLDSFHNVVVDCGEESEKD